MNENFKIWCKNEKEILEFLLWAKRNNYHSSNNARPLPCELIHQIAKSYSSCGFILFNKTKEIYISPIIEHSYFRESCPHSTKEFTFEEFKKLYLEENKMIERKISNNYDIMPKLETGMFVENQEGKLGVIVNDIIMYQNGEYDTVQCSLNESGWITAVYKKGRTGFNLAREHSKEDCIWKFKPCVEISKKEIVEKFDLIDSEYLEIIIINPPCECNIHPMLQNGDFIHSVNNGWGVVVGNGIVYKEKGFDYVNKIAYSEEIDAVDRMAFSFEDCGNNKNMWHKTYHILESKFRKVFNIPENYDFKIVD